MLLPSFLSLFHRSSPNLALLLEGHFRIPLLVPSSRWSIVGLGLLSVCSFVQAQRMALSDSSAEPVVIESAAVSMEVTARFAVTTFDLVFRNPNSRQLEGVFDFPLLEGQSVIRFGLDIDGHLREAVPIEKQRGRVVFEEIERRRVDPGLLEQTVGNNYRARVFPLPAGGTRRIVIAYQEEVQRTERGESPYRLALDLAGRLKRFSLDLAIHAETKATADIHTTLPLEFPAWTDSKTISLERNDFEARGIVEFVLPQIEGPTTMTQRLGSREYFSTQASIGPVSAAQRAKPKIVSILWDASGSGRERDHSKEYVFLDEWFETVPNVEVRLILLRDVAAVPVTFRIRRGDWTALRGALENVTYDGATSFDGVSEDESIQEWLVFSDGLFNYGTTMEASQLPVSAPVHAICSSSRADTTRMRAIALRNGGEYVNLMAADASLAVKQVRSNGIRVLGIERDPEAVAQLFPEVGSLIDSSILTVSGILRTSEATIRISIGRSASDAREIVLNIQSGESSGQLAARAWAMAKIASLSLDRSKNGDDIRRTSQEFGIVTADTSLIVLETLEDYLLYEVVPPEEMRSEWEAQRLESQSELGKARASHLDEVADAFAEKKKWWTTSFPKDRPPPPPSDQGGGDSATRSDGFGAPSSDEDRIVLSPFEVASGDDTAYRAGNTLAGTRIRTNLRDIGHSVSVYTEQFLQDTGAVDSSTLLQYSSNTEARGVSGDFLGVADSPQQQVSSIKLQPWSPTAGYIDRLRRSASGDRYAVYLEERVDHQRDPGFFADVADLFFEQNENQLALRILSNLAELELENAALLRILGQRLMRASHPELAVPLYERVLRIRGEEPQSRRDLALACAATQEFQRAVDLLWEVVERPWDDRFLGVELVALEELNAIAETCGPEIDLSKVDHRLRGNLAVGLRVVLIWDADNCDIDLWVDDPDGERAMYSHALTHQGGLMSPDFTNGYGPEVFLLREPKLGKYTIHINYFGDVRNTSLGPVTAQVRLITGFGTLEQAEQCLTVRLKDTEETIQIGSVEISDQKSVQK